MWIGLRQAVIALHDGSWHGHHPQQQQPTCVGFAAVGAVVVGAVVVVAEVPSGARQRCAPSTEARSPAVVADCLPMSMTTAIPINAGQ